MARGGEGRLCVVLCTWHDAAYAAARTAMQESPLRRPARICCSRMSCTISYDCFTLPYLACARRMQTAGLLSLSCSVPGRFMCLVTSVPRSREKGLSKNNSHHVLIDNHGSERMLLL